MDASHLQANEIGGKYLCNGTAMGNISITKQNKDPNIIAFISVSVFIMFIYCSNSNKDFNSLFTPSFIGTFTGTLSMCFSG